MAHTKTLRICNKKPERVCSDDNNDSNERQVVQDCRDHYETVCQTSYAQKNVTEDKISCQMVQEKMCHTNNDQEEHCINVPKRVSGYW